MSREARYPVYQPKMPATWWLRNANYFLFMLRELSSLFIALFALIYLSGISRAIQGKESYDVFLAWLQTPASRLLSLLIFVFSIYHAVTWFQSAGKVMVVRLGGKTLSPSLMLIGNCLLWAIISVVLFNLMVG